MDASTSPRASSPPSADTMQVVVNTTPGKSKSSATDILLVNANDGLQGVPLKVSPSHTVANVLEFLSASIALPAGSQLVLAGKQLDPAITVGELKLEESSTLNLFMPSPRNSQEPEAADAAAGEASSAATSGTSTPTSTKRKSNKPRCTKEGCKAVAPPIVGDCGFCQQRFCGKHRMLESHNCPGLADARQADKDRNTAKLEHERTVALRGL